MVNVANLEFSMAHSCLRLPPKTFNSNRAAGRLLAPEFFEWYLFTFSTPGARLTTAHGHSKRTHTHTHTCTGSRGTVLQRILTHFFKLWNSEPQEVRSYWLPDTFTLPPSPPVPPPKEQNKKKPCPSQLPENNVYKSKSDVFESYYPWSNRSSKRSP